MNIEECAGGMEVLGQRSSDAVERDVQMKPLQEECAGGMGKNSNYAAVKDVRIQRMHGDFVSEIGQRSIYAVVRDVRIGLL